MMSECVQTEASELHRGVFYRTRYSLQFLSCGLLYGIRRPLTVGMLTQMFSCYLWPSLFGVLLVLGHGFSFFLSSDHVNVQQLQRVVDFWAL